MQKIYQNLQTEKGKYMSNIQHSLSKTLFEIFNFIEGASKNELLLREMVAMMGWELDELAGFEIEDLSDALRSLSTEVKELSIHIEEPPNSFSEFKEVLELSKSLFEHIEGLNQVIENLNFEGLGKDRLGEFAKDALKYIITLYISIKYPLFYHSAVLLTIIKAQDRLEPIAEPDGNIIRRPTIFPAFEPGRIPALFSDPISLLKEEYFPNGLQTDKDAVNAANRLFPRIAALLNELGVTTVLGFNREYGLDFGEHGNRIMAGMLTAFADIDIAGQEQELAVSLALSPASREDLGLVIIPSGQFNFLQTIGNWGVEATMSAGIEALAIGREEVTLLASAETTSFEAALSLIKLSENEDSSSFLLGSLQSTHLKIGNFLISTTVDYQNDHLSLDIFAQADNSSFVFSPSDGDGFIQSILPSEGFELEFDFGIGWSNKNGLYFKGEVGMETTYPVNKSFFNLILINQLHLKLLAKDSNIGFQASVGFGLQIGPFKVIINGSGLKADIDNLGESGNIGFGNLSIDFVPPTRVGFQVNTAPVKGGGYLLFEPENGRYVGLAELSIVDKFTVKAIAVINTELPDGQEGYSFLLMITGEFSPIQLGFGFTLEGVGGLIGIHRSMNLEAIREKVRGDSFDQVLFPEDPINNVHSIIASLDSIFPIQEGQYSFGIMGKIGWGTPKLIDIKAGLIFQVPRFKMAIIGTAKSEIVRTSVPEDGEEPERIVLLRLQISFAAWFEPEKSLFRFDASLFNSEILGKKLTGDAALRLRGGDNPYFMLSVGGFHPEFEPPKGLGLGKLNRIEIAFKPESVDIDVSAKFYAAVTSNTVQVGAELGAEYDGPGFRIGGKIGFDALFQFRPIYFKVDAWGEVIIHALGGSWGLGIKGTIEGPYPYRFSLFVTVDAFVGSKDFRIPTFTIGSEARKERPTIDVLEELRVVIEDDRSWSPVLLDRNEILVSLRDRRKEFSGSESAEEAERALIVHPFGGIKIDQDRAPLGVILERFGHKQPDRYNFFSIELFSIELEKEETEELERFFAPAQFFDLKKEEKLSRPSFEKMDSGVQIKDFKKLQVSSRILEKEVRYETEYHDPHSPWRPSTEKPKKPMKDEDFVVWSAHSSIARSALGKKNKRPVRSNAITFETEKAAEDEFAIIHQDGNAGFTKMTSKNKATAHQQLEQLIIDNPELEDNLVVVPIYEIA
jgi:hypothetical protein